MERHASNGTIWTVGGLAPGGTAINNGRGQLVRSGTNARLFRTSFRASNTKPEEDSQKHEARLAAALGLDRTQRTLNTKIPSKIAIHYPKLSTQVVPTQWNGAEWVKNDPRISRLAKSQEMAKFLTVVEPEKTMESRILPAAPFR